MKKIYFGVAVLAILAVVSYMSFTEKGVIIKTEEKAPKIDIVAEKVSRMTLDEKIGQMMIIGFETPHIDSHIKDMIQNYHVGGVNLLKRNVRSKNQMLELTQGLRDTASSSTDIPFMIAVDQEGGNVNRFDFLKNKEAQINLPSGAQAYEESLKRGRELKEIGITVNFGPVADYVTNKKSYLFNRTFGVPAEDISSLASSMLRGYEDAGIQGTLKHFPGYGNILNDPHKASAGFDDVQLYEKSLQPFKDILSEERDRAVMTAHIVIPQIDSKPATLSSRFLKDILREEWKFEGVIITDDLEMVSVGKVSVPELAVEAVLAGNDMVISTYTSNLHPKIHDAIKKAVVEGIVSEKDIDKSVERILIFKKYNPR
ncbi:MAG: glycoside hydrolase family 3 N-terminal domain-containing protein [bacterium]|nr:glycoside hydrolase family 3 N-terminal domain-containing protein [bacterium]